MRNLLLLLLITAAISACTASQELQQEACPQEVPWYRQVNDDKMLELWRNATVKEWQEGDSWIRHWHCQDGNVLAIMDVCIDYFMANREYYENWLPSWLPWAPSGE